ncbi:hypothetical protein D3C81_1315160 [compost metagenome]
MPHQQAGSQEHAAEGVGAMDNIPGADDDIRHRRGRIRPQIHGLVEEMMQVIGCYQEAGYGRNGKKKTGYSAGKPFVHPGIAADQNQQERRGKRHAQIRYTDPNLNRSEGAAGQLQGGSEAIEGCRCGHSGECLHCL